MIYGPPTYQMGDEAPTAAAARRELKDMQGALKKWLKYRQLNDDVASGKIKTKVPREIAALRLSQNRDFEGEQKLANELHALLSEVFDSASLPDPRLGKNVSAAVKLAKIAIAGKLPSDVDNSSAAGFVWLWPMVIVLGMVAFTITSVVKTQAEAQAEKEHTECIKSGACTDYGFWLKVAGVAVVGWILWDKVGLGDRIKGALKK